MSDLASLISKNPIHGCLLYFQVYICFNLVYTSIVHTTTGLMYIINISALIPDYP